MEKVLNTQAALLLKARVARAGKMLTGIATFIFCILSLGYGGNGDALTFQMEHTANSLEVANLMADVSRSNSLMLLYAVVGVVSLLACVLCIYYEKHLWHEFHSMQVFAHMQKEGRRRNVPIITLF